MGFELPRNFLQLKREKKMHLLSSMLQKTLTSLIQDKQKRLTPFENKPKKIFTTF